MGVSSVLEVARSNGTDWIPELGALLLPLRPGLGESGPM
jgi:hypothetical protein